jgi:dethiobiotin synthetase
MKPVASGCVETPDGLRNDDALALQAASSTPPSYALINPVALRDPLSPHLAAEHDGVEISLAPMRVAFDQLRASHQRVVVEGVGGWLVPLAPGLFASDIARQWQLPVILVVGLRLGCLNHALLSARAIVDDGCRLLGWIGNRVDPAMDAVEENLATLEQLLPAPCLGVLPHGVAPAQAASRLAGALAALD